MMTTLDAQTTDVCQCARAKESGENEGDPGTTVIYPDCHLEEETAREHEDAEQTVVKQAALPDEKRVYTAFKSSPSLMRIAAQGPSEQSIRLVIRKRQKGQQTFAKSTRKLVKEFGTTAITTSLKSLLDGGVFMCTDTAKRRFPDLFPEEQVQESAKETIVMCESQPEDRECETPRDAAPGIIEHLIY